MNADVWSKADLHIHSAHSDGLATIAEIMEHVATNTDLSVIAVTDHNTIEGALLAKDLEPAYGVEVVIGEEVSTKEGHVLGLFINEEIPPRLTAAETVRRIADQGGIAIIPHPFSPQGVFGPFGRGRLADAAREMAFHALEVYNSVPYLIWANRIASKMFSGGLGVAAVGGSDAHVLQGVGKGYTVFRGTTAEDLRLSIDALETHAEADRGGLALALRYMRSIPQIRRRQAFNRARCHISQKAVASGRA